jgi:acyl-CoA synthetase (AMP-forming)/AMP-acid ligase II
MQPYRLTLNHFLEHAARWHGDVCVVTGGSGDARARVPYTQLKARSQALSGALLALGLKHADHLAVMAWNSHAHLECWYGAMGIGVVCHTLNPRLSRTQLADMIRQAGDRLLIVSADLTPLAAQLVTLCPMLEHLIVLEEPGTAPALPDCPHPRTWHYEELLRQPGQDVPWGEFDENSAAGLCFTSGTTGAPKGVVYTHRSNYLHTLHQLQADVSGLTASDSVLVSVPMFHANGWGLPFAGPAVGAKLVLPGRHQDGASLTRLINAEEVTIAAGVATVWLGLVDYLDQSGEEVPSLQRIMLGGSSVPQGLMDRLEQRLGATVQTSWGMTELSPIGTVTPATAVQRRSSQAGRPIMGVELMITAQDGQALERGQKGHLHVRGASVIERYFGQDTSAVDAEGWFDTGDLATLDEAGILSITGRAKDLIKSGGEWINPAEIEAIVGALPEVALVAVVGRADPKWGERPVLIVEARKGAHISDEVLLAALRPRVAKWWLPDAIVHLSAMPIAMTGKIDKNRLQAEYGSS